MAISAGVLGFCGTFYAQYVLLVDPPSVLAGSISVIIALVTIFGGIRDSCRSDNRQRGADFAVRVFSNLFLRQRSEY
jgi:hypothetical protein